MLFVIGLHRAVSVTGVAGGVVLSRHPAELGTWAHRHWCGVFVGSDADLSLLRAAFSGWGDVDDDEDDDDEGDELGLPHPVELLPGELTDYERLIAVRDFLNRFGGIPELVVGG